jgi:peptidoglycan/xylan/chitin deacetylase (PgdA/CDA1 family)
MIEVINAYKDFEKHQTIADKSRNLIRNLTLRVISLNKSINKSANWIRFPYYHHVFNDERKDFERQLRYLKNYGEFISMDHAVQMIGSDVKIDGNYFCVSFDDGFYNCYSNMMEITDKLQIPVIIYLPTDFIGLSESKEEDLDQLRKFYPEKEGFVPFLSWENCLEMLNHKISFGSHTGSHANLSKLGPIEIENELTRSKKKIEEKLNISCDHFACPWGRMNLDFFPEVTTEIAKRVGYKSFATTNRGKMEQGSDLFLLKRDHVIAEWSNFQLKYFFGK